jgi:Stress responsive A/B Barrel Domain
MRSKAAAVLVLVFLLAWGESARAAPPEPPNEAPVLHVVLIELKPDAPAGEGQALIADAKRLLSEIPGVHEVRVGRKALADRDVHIKDYDIALLVRLGTASDLVVYAADPRQHELIAKHQAHVARYRVIDFLSE